MSETVQLAPKGGITMNKKKETFKITLSAEATNRLFTEYCRRVQAREKRFSKSSIVEDLIMELLPVSTSQFDINNITKEEK